MDRRYVDFAINQLWMAYFELTDTPEGREIISDQDLELFNDCARHPAVQNKLRNPSLDRS